MELVISGRGNVRCVYNEAIELNAIGKLYVRRGSHVEPDLSGTWSADLSPVGGPILGPFDKRSEALEAELQWLSANWLTPSAD